MEEKKSVEKGNLTPYIFPSGRNTEITTYKRVNTFRPHEKEMDNFPVNSKNPVKTLRDSSQGLPESFIQPDKESAEKKKFNSNCISNTRFFTKNWKNSVGSLVAPSVSEEEHINSRILNSEKLQGALSAIGLGYAKNLSTMERQKKTIATQKGTEQKLILLLDNMLDDFKKKIKLNCDEFLPLEKRIDELNSKIEQLKIRAGKSSKDFAAWKSLELTRDAIKSIYFHQQGMKKEISQVKSRHAENMNKLSQDHKDSLNVFSKYREDLQYSIEKIKEQITFVNSQLELYGKYIKEIEAAQVQSQKIKQLTNAEF